MIEIRENGILHAVDAEAISARSKTFPKPGPDQPTHREQVVQTQRWGLALIRYRLCKSKHHKNVNWFWSAVFAEQVSDQCGPPIPPSYQRPE